MEHLLVIYSDSGHGHTLDSVPQSDYLTDNCSKKVGMQITHLLSAFHANFSSPSHPIFELKWSVLLSSLCLQKVYTFPYSGDLSALVFRFPLDAVHPMPWRFLLRSSKIP